MARSRWSWPEPIPRAETAGSSPSWKTILVVAIVSLCTAAALADEAALIDRMEPPVTLDAVKIDTVCKGVEVASARLRGAGHPATIYAWAEGKDKPQARLTVMPGLHLAAGKPEARESSAWSVGAEGGRGSVEMEPCLVGLGRWHTSTAARV